MCFQLFCSVDNVEDPDFEETINVMRVPGGVQIDLPEHFRVMGGMLLRNATVKYVLDQAAKIGKIVEVDKDFLLTVLPERSLLVCAKIERLFHDAVPDELMFATPDMRMDTKSIVITLEDFSFLAMVSVTYTPEAELPADVLAQRVMKVKFAAPIKEITVYQRSNFNPKDYL